MSLKCKRGKLVATVFLLSTVLAAPVISQLPGPPKRGTVGRKAVELPVPNFALIDQDQKPFHAHSLHGKVALVSFIYTTCPDVCPLLTAKIAGIQRKLKSQGVNGHFFVSITTDPDVDKPTTLKSYGKRFGADFRSWAFLTGDKNELSEAWRFFGVRVNKRGKGLTDHTGVTTLIDREGIRRIDYYGDSWTEKEVLSDIAELAKDDHAHAGTKHEAATAVEPQQRKHHEKAPSKPILNPSGAASVRILGPKEGEVFKGDEVPVHFKLINGKGGEHVHAYVNGELMGMFKSEKGTLTGIRPGRHRLEIRLVAEDHQTELGATDKVNFVVQ